MTAPSTLDCPVCGRELGVAPRLKGERWTPQQTWLAKRLMELGAGRKFIAQTLGGGSTPQAVYEHVWLRRPQL